MEFIIAHKVEILSILWLVSELLGENKKIEANSVYGFIKILLKKALGK